MQWYGRVLKLPFHALCYICISVGLWRYQTSDIYISPVLWCVQIFLQTVEFCLCVFFFLFVFVFLLSIMFKHHRCYTDVRISRLSGLSTGTVRHLTTWLSSCMKERRDHSCIAIVKFITMITWNMQNKYRLVVNGTRNFKQNTNNVFQYIWYSAYHTFARVKSWKLANGYFTIPE